MKQVEYLIALIISHAIASILTIQSLDLNLIQSTTSNDFTGEIIFIYIMIGVAGVIMPFAATWSRLVDAGRLKYLSFLILIPIISLYPIFVGLFTPTHHNRM